MFKHTEDKMLLCYYSTYPTPWRPVTGGRMIEFSSGHPPSLTFHWWAHDASRGLNSKLWWPRITPSTYFYATKLLLCLAGVVLFHP